MRAFYYIEEQDKKGYCKKLLRTFAELAENKDGNPENIPLYHITKRSYYLNFKTIFGYDHSLIKDKLWKILSKGEGIKI